MIEFLDRQATGRHVIIMFVAALSVLLTANVFSTRFYRQTGGEGLLDLAGRGRNATAAGWPPRPGGFTLTLDVLVPTVAFPLLALALLCLTRPYRTTILVTRSRVSGLVR